MIKKLRKGMLFRRRSDGFVFRVESTGNKGRGAFLHCVDASKIYGWFWLSELGHGFDRVKSKKTP